MAFYTTCLTLFSLHRVTVQTAPYPTPDLRLFFHFSCSAIWSSCLLFHEIPLINICSCCRGSSDACLTLHALQGKKNETFVYSSSFPSHEWGLPLTITVDTDTNLGIRLFFL